MPVYIACQGGTEFVKIGWAKDDPAQRIKNLSVGSPFPIDIVRIIDGDRAVEKWLQDRFRAFRIEGSREWFLWTADMLVVEPPTIEPSKRSKKNAVVLDKVLEEALRNAIEKAGSQTAYARSLGVAHQFISNIWNGTASPSQKVLDNLGLAQKVERRIEKFYGEKQPRQAAE